MQPIDPQVILSMRSVRCRRAGREVLRGVDLTVQRGETVGIVGANGSGKSTLLRVAAGLLRARSGDVRVFGASPRQSRTRSHLGWLPDRPLLPTLTVREVLRLCRQTTGSSAAAGAKVAVELCIEPLLDQQAAELSQGQARRVALALALVHSPPLLLLDEPFTALDGPSKAAVQAALDRAIGEGTTIVAAAPSLADLHGLECRAHSLSGGQLVPG